MTDNEQTIQFAAESASLALELYQKLGTSVYEFLQTKQASNTLASGGVVNLTQKDFLVAILSFTATETLRIFDSVKADKSKMRDVINDVVLEFRGQLENQLKEYRENAQNTSNENPSNIHH